MADPDLKAIKDFTYTKYVDYGTPSAEVDEGRAMEILEAHFRSTPATVDGENYLLGILLFENAENHPEKRRQMLAAARVIFDGYRTRTGEKDFDPVEDRLSDIEDAFGKLPEKDRTALLERAARDWAGVEGPAAPAEPEKPAVPGMVMIPAGPFLSGSSKALRETASYWIDTYPVTNEQYAAFCQGSGYRQPKFWTEGRFRNPTAPVVGVSWFDAYKYAAWAGKQLPTFEQWEKAGRGKSGRIFPWGDQIDHNKAVYGQPEGSDAVAEVGHCAENVAEHGTRDMVGNVWQWTDTWDRQEPEMKIICGGSWVDPVEFLRLDQHLATNPKDKFDNIGFRCVKLAE